MGQRLLHAANLYEVTAHYYTKGTHFQIDLETMEQKNMKTKDVDEIRIRPAGENKLATMLERIALFLILFISMMVPYPTKVML